MATIFTLATYLVAVLDDLGSQEQRPVRESSAPLRGGRRRVEREEACDGGGPNWHL